ncbi:MAG: HsdM family class I SAM-dependent methyltransferase [Actinomycetota bacterium]
MHINRQLPLFAERMVAAEVSVADPGTDYGEVFTRRWVVELILDLAGYTSDRDLAGLTLVEPSCGTGAFLVPIVERLVASSKGHGRRFGNVSGALRAFDVLEANAERSRKAVAAALRGAGVRPNTADRLASEWVTTGDFLLPTEVTPKVDFVVGNPPYVRLESVPRPVMEAYRSAYSTMRGRSDLYVGFIERGLDLLKPEGVLGYICADRWMRNQYGADLRALISECYAVDTVIAMHDVDAFEDAVSAYPAIIVLRNSTQARTTVVEANGSFGETDAANLAAWVRRSRPQALNAPTFQASRIDDWFDGHDLWPSGSPAQLAAIADLESRFPPLEDTSTGTRVGIGVATGCDRVFITRDSALVEPDRLLPLVQAGDTASGDVVWSGTYLVNPWNGDGLVDLEPYPRLRRYFESNAEELRARHVARKRPVQWYRTIDRVDPDLLHRSKLVLPDLKAAAHPVLDDGTCYPHHNLYYVVSDTWDLEVLGGLLLSDIANLFVGSYCVKMRGGCYRFQAQYLRRIRVPCRESISKRDARALSRAFISRDAEAATWAALRVYGLSELPGHRVNLG